MKEKQMYLFAEEKKENEFVPVFLHKICGEKLNCVDARELYNFLQSKRGFSHWIKDGILEGQFDDGIDFITCSEEVLGKKALNLGGRPSQEYILTLDMAKELAMLEKNNQGKRIRRYFIKVEKAFWENVRGDFGKWLEKRHDGIKVRRELTDWIKEFVEYALKQDNTNASMYYAFITATINKALFKCPSAKKIKKNLRDLLGSKQLAILEVAEIIATKEIEEGMDNNLLCTRVYKNIVEKINAYAGLTGSSIPELIHYNEYRLITNDKNLITKE